MQALARPQPLDRPIQFRLTKDEYETLRSLAWSQDIHVATYITQTVRAAIKAATIRGKYPSDSDQLVG